MNNPKPNTTCPMCRAAMRRWALNYLDPRTPNDIRPACLRVAKSYRSGWLGCFPGEIHETRNPVRNRARDIIDSALPRPHANAEAKLSLERLNASIHCGSPSSHA